MNSIKEPARCTCKWGWEVGGGTSLSVPFSMIVTFVIMLMFFHVQKMKCNEQEEERLNLNTIRNKQSELNSKWIV